MRHREAAIPAASGVDFTLQLGGAIAGTVMDAEGNPIADAYLLACEYDDAGDVYCKDTMSDPDGNYQISGLPPTDYRVWADTDGFAGEYYDNVPNHESATPVTVNAGSTTGGIDFWLDSNQ